MSDLPEIKIMVEERKYPTLFLRRKWSWKVLTWRDGIDGEGFYAAILYYDFLEGNARTREDALKKARNVAVKYCNKLLAAKLEKDRIKKSREFEKVTCEGL